MKIRRSILFLTAAVALLAALMFWYGKEKPAETQLANLLKGDDAQSEKSQSHPSIAAPATRPNHPPANTAIAISTPNQKQGNKIERMRGVLSTYNDAPIDFYGKLEDQFGNPVAGAEVRASIRVISGVRQTTDWLTTTSDANGLFEFHGKGQDIGMMPFKSGYALASLNTGGNYSHFYPEEQRLHPVSNNPVVIKMWKLQGSEPLVSINQQYKVEYAEALNFDLISGKIVPNGGDLHVVVSRPPGMISGRSPKTWGLKLQAVNGGLIESGGQEAVTYSAPETGYQQSVSLFAPTNGHGIELIQQGFFFTSRNGQIYGKLGISFRINRDPEGLMSIRLTGIMNANSSRNLEGDPNTMRAASR